MLYSSQRYQVYKYVSVFSKLPYEFVISPLVPFDCKSDQEQSTKAYCKVVPANVIFSPIFLRSSNESFRNLSNPLILLHDLNCILKAMIKSKPDAIIGMYLLHAYPLVFLKRILNFKLYTLAVGGDIYEEQTRFYNLVRRLVYRNNSKIFAVSYELRDRIKKNSDYNAIVVPNGCSTPAFFKSLSLKSDLRSKWRIREQDFRSSYIV